MTSRIPLAIAFLALLAASPAFAEEVISTRNGSVYVGDVTELTPKAVTIKLQSPKKGTRRFALEDLTDTTLWRLRSKRIGAQDGKAMMALGSWAEDRGLLLAAVHEYRRATGVKAAAARAKSRFVALAGRLARELFERGEALFVEELPDAALAQYKAVIERYPHSEAARAARERVALVRSLLKAPNADVGAGAQGVKKAASVAWGRIVKSVEGRLHKAARYEKKAARETRPVRQAGALKKAVVQIEAAWALVSKLAGSTDDVPPSEALLLKATVRERLIGAYLKTGLSYLTRRSLNQAQEYCVKIGELDSDHEKYSLHARIIEARLARTWAAPSSGRLSGRRGPTR